VAVAVLEEASVAETGFGPCGDGGTTNAHANCPFKPTESDPEVQVGVVEPIVKAVMVELAAYPFPLAVTDVPTTPLVGVSDKLVVTSNKLVPILVPSVAVTAVEPAGEGGTLNVQ
jgi:hypothetical protein